MAVSFHHRTVQERLVALDVLAPRHIRRAGRERPADEIGDRVAIGAGERGAHPATDTTPGHAVQAHQASDPLHVDDDAAVAERAVHPRDTVVAVGRAAAGR